MQDVAAARNETADGVPYIIIGESVETVPKQRIYALVLKPYHNYVNTYIKTVLNQGSLCFGTPTKEDAWEGFMVIVA